MRILKLTLLILAIWPSAITRAQSIVWDDNVKEALPVFEGLPEELRAQPLTYGRVQYLASAETEFRYDDNIRATDSPCAG